MLSETLNEPGTSVNKYQSYYYLKGQGVADVGNVSDADFDYNRQGFDKQVERVGQSQYVVGRGDTLKGIAASVFGDASLWYLIAQANGISGDADLADGMTLSIPANLNHTNNSETFRPYNPGDIIGDTTPSAVPPPPPKNSCNVLATLVIVAVTIAVTVATSGAAANLGPALSAGLGAAAGSAAGQLTGIALGVRDSFSFSEVFTTGLTAAATAGLADIFAGNNQALEASRLGRPLTSAEVQAARTLSAGQRALVAATGVVTQASGNIITRNDSGFRWSNVAASAVTSSVVGIPGNDNVLNNIVDGNFGTQVITNIAASGLNYAVTKGGFNEGTWNTPSVLANAFGSAIGNSIIDAFSKTSEEKKSDAKSGKTEKAGANGETPNQQKDDSFSLDFKPRRIRSIEEIADEAIGKATTDAFNRVNEAPTAVSERAKVEEAAASAPSTSERLDELRLAQAGLRGEISILSRDLKRSFTENGRWSGLTSTGRDIIERLEYLSAAKEVNATRINSIIDSQTVLGSKFPGGVFSADSGIFTQILDDTGISNFQRRRDLAREIEVGGQLAYLASPIGSVGEDGVFVSEFWLVSGVNTKQDSYIVGSQILPQFENRLGAFEAFLPKGELSAADRNRQLASYFSQRGEFGASASEHLGSIGNAWTSLEAIEFPLSFVGARLAGFKLPPNRALPNPNAKFELNKQYDKLDFSDPDTFCTECAVNISKAANGEGKLVVFSGKGDAWPSDYDGFGLAPSELKLPLNNGQLARYGHHTVYTDGKYIYDPFVSTNPIPQKNYVSILNDANQGGISWRIATPEIPAPISDVDIYINNLVLKKGGF